MPLVMIAGHEGQQMAFDDETLQQQLDFRGIYLLWQKLTFLFANTKKKIAISFGFFFASGKVNLLKPSLSSQLSFI